MLANREALTKALSKPITLSAAPARGLRMQLGLPPNRSDLESFLADEVLSRIEALEAHFGFDSNVLDPPRLLRAIIEYMTGVHVESPNWEIEASVALMREHVIRISAVTSGRPKKWTDGALFALYADVQKLKAQYPERKGDDFWEALRAHHHRTWGQFSKATLRKAYAQAKKIAQKSYAPSDSSSGSLKI